MTCPRTIFAICGLIMILLAALASVEDAGVYGTVSRCMIAGVFVATAVQQVVQPRLRNVLKKINLSLTENAKTGIIK